MSALLNTFGIDWHLVLFNMLNFAILVAALSYLLYKPVMNMVRTREQVVRKGVEDAEAAAEKLSAADAEAGIRIGAAETQATDIVQSARQTATDERIHTLKEAEARAAQIARDAEARAKEVAAKALRESEQEIARLAILAAAKVLEKKT